MTFMSFVAKLASMAIALLCSYYNIILNWNVVYMPITKGILFVVIAPSTITLGSW
jgi:hypothetical protein